jgi:hypothetical protein
MHVSYSNFFRVEGGVRLSRLVEGAAGKQLLIHRRALEPIHPSLPNHAREHLSGHRGHPLLTKTATQRVLSLAIT